MPGFANVCGILLPTREQTGTLPESVQGSLVVTPTVQRNMEAAAMALCQKRPLLLEGPPGERSGSELSNVLLFYSVMFHWNLSSAATAETRKGKTSEESLRNTKEGLEPSFIDATQLHP